ncbi:MAG: PA14 domain-containing protein, partial [Gemmatimonadota bacterium]|nr:PA14 domain-containing protein [Gemmatimonadota bacterium]
RIARVPSERFVVEAEGAVVLPEGNYEVVAISDDGIRVWVDGVLMIDRWAAHESIVDRIPLASGRHRLRVEYYQVDGWAELRVEVLKR